MNAIFPFFKWVDTTWLSRYINDSKWLFPAIEGVHIVALALLFGTVIILNLRLLGLTMRQKSAAQLAQELNPWTFSSLVIILLTGALLFVAEAVKSFYSTPFRIKMILLLSAIVFHYGISTRILHRDGRVSVVGKAVAVLGILLWVGVGFAGRAIGFF